MRFNDKEALVHVLLQEFDIFILCYLKYLMCVLLSPFTSSVEFNSPPSLSLLQDTDGEAVGIPDHFLFCSPELPGW